MPTWDAGLYLTFADERTRPAMDLAARVDVPSPARVVDLGCGPGNSTAVLRARWPSAEVVGVDSSPDMIAAATKARPDGRWVQADVAAWAADRPFDVVFSNAALHWVREDHAALFPRLFGMVEVRFETGAGGKDELTIGYVTAAEADALRETVRARKSGAVAAEGEAAAP